MMVTVHSSAGLTAAELTAQNLDKSALLNDVIQRAGGDPDELLAEFELAFVLFLYGQSLEGEHFTSAAVVHAPRACCSSPHWLHSRQQ
jgi:AAR2 protein